MLKRGIRYVLIALLTLLGLPPLLLVVLLLLANTDNGRAQLQQHISLLSGGRLHVSGLSGHVPDAMRIARVECWQGGQPWLRIEQLTLQWSPSHLLRGVLLIERLDAGRVVLHALPALAVDSTAPPPSLPLKLALRTLHIAEMNVEAAALGQPGRFSAVGAATWAGPNAADLSLHLTRLDGAGTYRAEAKVQADVLTAHATAHEPPHGWLLTLADIAEPDALALDATLTGPLSAATARLALAFGALTVTATGAVDVPGRRLSGVQLVAKAPAMHPRSDVAWQAIAAQMQLDGPFNRPSVQGQLQIDAWTAGPLSASRLHLAAQGDAAHTQWQGEINGLALRGLPPTLFDAAPLILQADVRRAAAYPLRLSVQHPLFSAEGKWLPLPTMQSEWALTLADLRPVAAHFGQSLTGTATLKLHVTPVLNSVTLAGEGGIAVSGGAAWAQSLGRGLTWHFAAKRHGSTLELQSLHMDGAQFNLTAAGLWQGQQANFKASAHLQQLAGLWPGAAGHLNAVATLSGPADHLDLAAQLEGEVAVGSMPRSPLNADLRVDGLPATPQAQLNVRGRWLEAPLELALTAAPSDDAWQFSLKRADWKSLHGSGDWTLARDAALPQGNLHLTLAQLADLRPVLALPLTGSADATLQTTTSNTLPHLRLHVTAKSPALAAASAQHMQLELQLADALRHPLLTGRLSTGGLRVGAVSGDAQTEFSGSLAALKLNLSAALHTALGPARINAEADADLLAQRLVLASLRCAWQDETAQLLAPAHLRWAPALAVDNLRLGWRTAELVLAGQISPKLAISARLHHAPAAVLTLVLPSLASDGQLQAEAELSGSWARPTGTLALEADGLRLRTGLGRGLPPVQLNAAATLNGTAAQIDAQARAGGEFKLHLSGTAPLQPSGLLDMQADGTLNLQLFDAVLGAEGRRLRGLLLLDGTLTGPLAAPLLAATAQLHDGEAQDSTAGLRLTSINAHAEADSQRLRLDSFAAKAGAGKLTASGEIEWAAAGMPLSLRLNAHEAQLFASDALNANLNAELILTGLGRGALALQGGVHVNRAELRIPERLPTNIAVLAVQRPGQASTAPVVEPSPRTIGLDVRIHAPEQVFVRGQNVEAELGGTVHLRGTALQPQPEGSFSLRRGQYNLVGRTLLFHKGEIGFDGGSLRDPSLHFVAKSSGGKVAAFLQVGGSVRQPQISLTSLPELPQDEVLAQLLFGRSAAKLSGMELLQIGTALASLSGMGLGVGSRLDDLRQSLGLDRLSIGATVEAGRYVAPGVYLGARRGVGGGKTQAMLQVDLYKGLKLEGAVGAGAATSGANTTGANSVGIIYQYEY